MTESGMIVVAIIGAIQGITIALIGVLSIRMGRVRKDTRATKEQMVNDHTTNFREENDGRHAETRRWFLAIWDKMTIMDGRVIDLLLRVDSLEDTREAFTNTKDKKDEAPKTI